MGDDRVAWRQLWRRSNAAARHRNRAREQKTGQAPWLAEDFHDLCCAEELWTEDEAAAFDAYKSEDPFWELGEK